jgi:urease accessory protein
MNAAALLSGFQNGLLNPLFIPAHIVALLGLGLMIGQQERRRITLLGFVAGLIAGLVAVASAIGETPANTTLLAATAATGLAAASGWPAPALIGVPLALTVGASIGLDSPPKVVSIQAANAALAGTGLCAIVVVGLIAVVVASLPQDWPRIGARVLGSWIAASAILVLALRFAR